MNLVLKYVYIFFRKKSQPEIPENMKYLIAGLGNMHPEYDDTRHNIGFDVLDVMAEEAGIPWKLSHLGALAELKFRGRKLILLKPSTFMNRSGKSVKYWMDREKIPIDRLMVVADDIHLPYGTIRIRPKGSDGGHNGLRDVQNHLNTTNYPRMKLGIGNAFYPGQQSDYVLGKWSADERQLMPDILQKAGDGIRAFTISGIEQAMTRYNG